MQNETHYERMKRQAEEWEAKKHLGMQAVHNQRRQESASEIESTPYPYRWMRQIAVDSQSQYERLRRFTLRLMAVVAVETGIVAYLLWRAW